MKISYAKNEDDAVASVKGEGTSHLTVLALAISIVFIVVALGLWFGFSQSREAIESVPEAIVPPTVSPEVQQARVYEAIDGITQCHKNIPEITGADDRIKRQRCYYAVMTIFTTSAICDLVSLSAPARDVCLQAEKQFINDYPKGIPREDIPLGGVPVTTNTNSATNSGSGTQGSVSGNQNTNTAATGGSPSGGSAANTNATAGAVNTNTTVATDTTGSSGGTTTSGNQNTNSNTNQVVPEPQPDEEICIIDTGEVVLLEHTNNCQ